MRCVQPRSTNHARRCARLAGSEAAPADEREVGVQLSHSEERLAYEADDWRVRPVLETARRATMLGNKR